MAGRSVAVESRNLFAKFKRLDAAAQSGVKAVVRSVTQDVQADIKKQLDRPVAKRARGRKVRSKPGQSPRTDTGRMKRSIKMKFSPKGWVGSVTTDSTAQDKKGRRYPWMLESGTKTIKKRPLFKRAQRKASKTFGRKMANAMTQAVRKAERG